MPSPSPEALAQGDAYRLALTHRVRGGHAGERLGQGVGSSTEFHDNRAYQPGDDVRHLDWRAMARTGQVLVRQYREETLPQLDVLLDASRSMTTDPAKAQLALDLAAVLVGAGRADGYDVTLVLLGDEPRRQRGAEVFDAEVLFDGRRPLAETLREATPWLRASSLRVVLSDFLDPAGPDPLTRPVGRGAGGWALVQILSQGDVDPPREVARRLIDPEREERLELEIGVDLRARYLARLRRLVEGLRDACHARGGRHVELVSDRPWSAHCRGALLREGLLLPA